MRDLAQSAKACLVCVRPWALSLALRGECTEMLWKWGNEAGRRLGVLPHRDVGESAFLLLRPCLFQNRTLLIGRHSQWWLEYAGSQGGSLAQESILSHPVSMGPIPD